MKVGDRVKAACIVTEDGTGVGDESAKFPAPNYIHARKGEYGTIVFVEHGQPTVRFDRTRTATLVGNDEVRYL